MNKFLTASALGLFSLSALAAGPAKTSAHPATAPHAAAPRPAPMSYGDISEPTYDSCGLGWKVTQKRTVIAAITRATTNATVPPTFGMTSGTIGCDQVPFAKKDQAAATYAIANFENLRIEMAEGRGENLAAFAQTLGCASAESFGAMTKANYRTIMNGATDSPVVMFRNLKKLNACGV